MQKTITLIIFAGLFLIQCKTGNVTQATNEVPESIPVVLLLEDGLSPADLNLIKEVQVESMKRTSRSQNMWIIKVTEEISEVEKLLTKLREDKRVSKAAFETESGKSNSFKNTKSGTSDPVKN